MFSSFWLKGLDFGPVVAVQTGQRSEPSRRTEILDLPMIIDFFLAASLICLPKADSAAPHAAERFAINRLNDDQLGETLKRFHKIHRGTTCYRRPIEGFDEKKFKVEQSQWIECGLKESLSISGGEPTEQIHVAQPFGLLASFYKQRLALLTFTLEVNAMETVLPILERRYGSNHIVIRSISGAITSVVWTKKDTEVSARLVAVPPTIADGNLLWVGKGPSRSAVEIEIRSISTYKRTHGS